METVKTIAVIKAKTREGKLECEYENIVRIDDNVSTDEVIMKGGANYHTDLRTAFDALIIHLVVLCELGEYRDLESKPDLLNDFQVTGFTLGGSDEHAGCCLIGRKNLSTRKVLNLVSPFTKFDDETTDYKHNRDLEALVNKATEEAELYLSGKHEPSSQLNFPFKVVDVDKETSTLTIEV